MMCNKCLLEMNQCHQTFSVSLQVTQDFQFLKLNFHTHTHTPLSNEDLILILIWSYLAEDTHTRNQSTHNVDLNNLTRHRLFNRGLFLSKCGLIFKHVFMLFAISWVEQEPVDVHCCSCVHSLPAHVLVCVLVCRYLQMHLPPPLPHTHIQPSIQPRPSIAKLCVPQLQFRGIGHNHIHFFVLYTPNHRTAWPVDIYICDKFIERHSVAPSPPPFVLCGKTQTACKTTTNIVPWKFWNIFLKSWGSTSSSNVFGIFMVFATKCWWS